MCVSGYIKLGNGRVSSVHTMDISPLSVHHISLFSWICRTDPADVARVESKTFICTPDKYRTVPHVKPGVQGILGQWKSPEEADKLLQKFRGCMTGE